MYKLYKEKAVCVFIIKVLFCTNLVSQVQIGNDILGLGYFNRSGSSIAMSDDGNRVAVGANGNVRVFKVDKGSWSLVGSVLYGEHQSDLFGSAVSLSSNGKILAVGAKGYNKGDRVSGQLRIFKEVDGIWSEIGQSIAGGNWSGFFGRSVAVSSDGKRVAASADKVDSKGMIYIFQENNNVWSQVGRGIPGKAAFDGSSYSLSISSDGKRVAMGSYGNDDNGDGAGHVRVFQELNGVWSQVGSAIEGMSSGDGISYQNGVSLSGNGKRVVLGSRMNNNETGYVQIYQEDGGVWSQLGETLYGKGEGYGFGFSVNLSRNGNKVAVGAFNNNDLKGYVKVFQESNGDWSQLGEDIIDENERHGFGFSVAMSKNGERIAIGDVYDSTNEEQAGAVRIYQNYSPSLSLEKPLESQIKIYPNPVSESLKIDLINFQTVNIKVFDVSGRLVFENLNYNSNQKLNISSLKKGIYFVKIIKGSFVRIGKFFKKN